MLGSQGRAFPLHLPTFTPISLAQGLFSQAHSFSGTRYQRTKRRTVVQYSRTAVAPFTTFSPHILVQQFPPEDLTSPAQVPLGHITIAFGSELPYRSLRRYAVTSLGIRSSLFALQEVYVARTATSASHVTTPSSPTLGTEDLALAHHQLGPILLALPSIHFLVSAVDPPGLLLAPLILSPNNHLRRETCVVPPEDTDLLRQVGYSTCQA